MKKLILSTLLFIGFGLTGNVNADELKIENDQPKIEQKNDDVLNNKYVGSDEVHSIEIEYNNKKWILLQNESDLFLFVPSNIAKKFNLENGKDYNISYSKNNNAVIYANELNSKKWSNTEMWTNKNYINETMNVLKKYETAYELQIPINIESNYI